MRIVKKRKYEDTSGVNLLSHLSGDVTVINIVRLCDNLAKMRANGFNPKA